MTLIVGFQLGKDFGLVGDTKLTDGVSCIDRDYMVTKVQKTELKDGVILIGTAGIARYCAFFQYTVQKAFEDANFDIEDYKYNVLTRKFHPSKVVSLLAYSDATDTVFVGCEDNYPFIPKFLEPYGVAAIGSGAEMFYGALLAYRELSGAPDTFDDLITIIGGAINIIIDHLNYIEYPFIGFMVKDHITHPIKIERPADE